MSDCDCGKNPHEMDCWIFEGNRPSRSTPKAAELIERVYSDDKLDEILGSHFDWYPEMIHNLARELKARRALAVQDGPADLKEQSNGREAGNDLDSVGADSSVLGGRDVPLAPTELGPADSADQQGNQVRRLTEAVTRVEVINHKSNAKPFGRQLVHWEDDTKVELSLQDQGRTLKIFLSARSAAVPVPPSKSAPIELPARLDDVVMRHPFVDRYWYPKDEVDPLWAKAIEALGLSAPLREEDQHGKQ